MSKHWVAVPESKSIENLVYSEGTYQEGDFKGQGDASMSLARPYFKLVGDKNNPGGYMEGYDGSAWEWFKDPGIVIRTVGAASAAIRHYAGVESPLLDFESVQMPSGKALSAVQWGKIEANRDLPESWFAPPEFERTPLQEFIEHLYVQRTDVDAMLWTYHEFRNAYSHVDTPAAMNVAGFQILKTCRVNEAMALLENNAADYPGSADARFGLGRAYSTAGELGEARAQFELALRQDPAHRRVKAALEALDQRFPREDQAIGR